jgi:carbamoyl-phosphate synthase small subunit
VAETDAVRPPEGATGVLVLADGTMLWGHGFGAEGSAVGEVCFNTAMTGYQEVMTDPSYARRSSPSPFPHIGNVGANAEDIEAINPHRVGLVVREAVTDPEQFPLDPALRRVAAAATAGSARRVDTRALTRKIRIDGAPMR